MTLGLKIRFVYSATLMSSSMAKSKPDSDKSFQYIPRYWLEFFSSVESQWIFLDCIRLGLDDKNSLEDKREFHSFVLAVDQGLNCFFPIFVLIYD